MADPFSQPQLDESGAKSYLGSPGRRAHLAAGLGGAASAPSVGYDSGAAAAQLPSQASGADLTGASRQRSSSPWHFQLSAQAGSRLSAPESGVSTPVQGRSYSRGLSSGRTLAQQTAPSRTSYESALLAAVRRQIEAFEEKVNGRFDRLQQTNDRLREAQFSRLEEKMNTSEGQIPKLDRRLAELSGNYKGLSDEMQSQIRKTDILDDRLWEWRHQMEEEFRQKFSEFEQNVQKVSSSMRVISGSLEDEQKKQRQRVARLEAEINDKLLQHEETRETILNFHNRLDAVEERRMEDFSSSLVPSQRGAGLLSGGGGEELANAQLLSLFERRLEDVAGKVDRTFQDTSDVHARIAAHEEQLRALRTQLATREEHVRQLSERVERGDWESKIEQVRQALHAEDKQRIEFQELVQRLARRVDFVEQTQEDLRNALRNSRNEEAMTPAGGSIRAELFEDASPDRASSFAIQDMSVRLSLIEDRVSSLQQEASRWDPELAPRVGQLVQQLKEIVPKVVDHEKAIRDLQFGSSGVSPRTSASPTAAAVVAVDRATADRVERLEEEVRHLSTVALGSQPVAASGVSKQEAEELVNTVVMATSDVAKAKQDVNAMHIELEKTNVAVRQLADDLVGLREDLSKRGGGGADLPKEPRTPLSSPRPLREESPKVEVVTIRDPASGEIVGRIGKLETEVRQLVSTAVANSALQLPTKKEIDEVLNTLVMTTSDMGRVKQDVSVIQKELEQTNAAVRSTWEDVKNLHSDIEKRQTEMRQEIQDFKGSTERSAHQEVEVEMEKANAAIRQTWQDVKTLQADFEKKTTELKQEVQDLKGFAEQAMKSELEAEMQKANTAIQQTWRDVTAMQSDFEKKSAELKQEITNLQGSAEKLVRAELEAEGEKTTTAIRQTWQDVKNLQAEIEKRSAELKQELYSITDGTAKSMKQELQAEVEKTNIVIRLLMQDVDSLKQARTEVQETAAAGAEASLAANDLSSLFQEVRNLSDTTAKAMRKELETELEKTNHVVRVLMQDLDSVKQVRNFDDFGRERDQAPSNGHDQIVPVGGEVVESLKRELAEVRELSERAQEQVAGATSSIQAELARLSGVAQGGQSTAGDVLAELESMRSDLLELKQKDMGGDIAQVQEDLRQEIRDALLNFYARLEAIENRRPEDGATGVVAGGGGDAAEAVREEVRRLAETSAQLRAKVEKLEASAGAPLVSPRGGSLDIVMLQDLRQEVDALKASEKGYRYEVERTTEHQIGKVRQELTDITGELRQDVGKLLDAEFRSKQDLADLASRQQHDLARVEEAATRGEQAASQVLELRQELENLRREVSTQHGAVSGLGESEVRRLDGEITALRVRIDGISAGSGSGDAAQLAELLKSVKRDEEAEKNAHQRLLERIDEMFVRLSAVDAAVAAATSRA